MHRFMHKDNEYIIKLTDSDEQRSLIVVRGADDTELHRLVVPHETLVDARTQDVDLGLDTLMDGLIVDFIKLVNDEMIDP